MEKVRINKSELILVQGDITKQNTDVIVNAANNSLLGGGGVDGAIHTAAGPELLTECRTLNGCETGQAKITKGYNLPAKFVIHTVGPIWQGSNNNEKGLLASCYQKSLRLAEQNKIKSVSFPSISTGAYHFPLEQAASIALKTVIDYLKKSTFLKEVRFVLFSKKDYQIYYQTLNSILKK